jgi:hypothetical protein
MLKIWAFEKPWFLKKLRTTSGLCGSSKWTSLEAANADFGDNPQEFMR